MKIYVGNLSFQSTSEDLNSAFSEFGAIDNASIVLDRESGRSRGFGFVEMPNDDEAQNAINGLNQTELGGRNIIVNKAEAREERPRNNFRNDRGKNYGGGSGGNRRKF